MRGVDALEVGIFISLGMSRRYALVKVVLKRSLKTLGYRLHRFYPQRYEEPLS